MNFGASARTEPAPGFADQDQRLTFGRLMQSQVVLCSSSLKSFRRPMLVGALGSIREAVRQKMGPRRARLATDLGQFMPKIAPRALTALKTLRGAREATTRGLSAIYQRKQTGSSTTQAFLFANK
jgi:hypothetical protein